MYPVRLLAPSSYTNAKKVQQWVWKSCNFHKVRRNVNEATVVVPKDSWSKLCVGGVLTS